MESHLTGKLDLDALQKLDGEFPPFKFGLIHRGHPIETKTRVKRGSGTSMMGIQQTVLYCPTCKVESIPIEGDFPVL